MPREFREELNRRLAENEPGAVRLKWLNVRLASKAEIRRGDNPKGCPKTEDEEDSLARQGTVKAGQSGSNHLSAECGVRSAECMESQKIGAGGVRNLKPKAKSRKAGGGQAPTSPADGKHFENEEEHEAEKNFLRKTASPAITVE